MKCVFTLFAGSLLLSAAIQEPVRIASGSLSGAAGVDASIRVFKGVPFAAPPVGPLRWKPPQPVANWDGVRKAEDFSGICPQPARTGQSLLLPTSYRLGPSTEDCLYLNVWTAADSANAKLPVMLYLPGGGFTTGGGSALVFDGEALAKKGVIVVTTNYRLGALGFLAHPELTKESDHNTSGNYGLMDQVAALQWVKRNIAAFGGDPDRVTIFGQSAGAESVFLLMATPLARGLFHRAIAESGGPNRSPIEVLSQAEEEGVKASEELGVRSINELRKVPYERLLKLKTTFEPMVDGYVLPKNPISTFREGRQNDVPVLIGSNSAEGINRSDAVLSTYVEQIRGEARFAERFLQLYPNISGDKTVQMTAMTDNYAWRVRDVASLQTKTGKHPAFLYYFEQQPPKDAPFPGPAHSSELYYVFENQRLYKNNWTEWDAKLSSMMATYWTNFAKSGNPNGKGLPKWDAYSDNAPLPAMHLGDKVEMGKFRLDKDKLKFLDSYYDSKTPE